MARSLLKKTKTSHLIRTIASDLARAGIESSLYETHLIIRHCLKVKDVELLDPFLTLSEETEGGLFHIVRQRITRYPLQYLLGYTGFFETDFKVQEGVLIPRPETEILVAAALEILEKEFSDKRPSLVDIGTGCGNIAISLKRKQPACSVTATDLSPKALELAKQNARRHGLSNRAIDFHQGHLFAPLFDKKESFDIIISNPPYLSKEDLAHLQAEVCFEPVQALDGGDRGMDLIDRLIDESPIYLKSKGYLLIEFGLGQHDLIRNRVTANRQYQSVSFVDDLAGIKRVAVLQIK